MKPVDGRIRIKKELDEYNEIDPQTTHGKSGETVSGNDDRNSQLISELMTVRGAYNDTYFQLQKANELVAARERERDTACELVKKKKRNYVESDARTVPFLTNWGD